MRYEIFMAQSMRLQSCGLWYCVVRLMVLISWCTLLPPSWVYSHTLLACRWIQHHAATLQSITSQKTVGSAYFFLKFNRMVFTLYCWDTLFPHSVATSCPSKVWLSVCIHCSSKTCTHMHPMHVQNTYWTVFMDISLHGKYLKKIHMTEMQCSQSVGGESEEYLQLL